MNINKEYFMLIVTLNRLTECSNINERREIEKKFLIRLAKFKKHLESIEDKINSIANQALAASESKHMNQEDTICFIDRTMNAYRDLQFMTEKGEK